VSGEATEASVEEWIGAKVEDAGWFGVGHSEERIEEAERAKG
jgi:hypothetical protein